MSTALVWFRRDLRSFDHSALYQALRTAGRVHCAFVFDTDILDALPTRRDRRVEFIHASLIELDAELAALSASAGNTKSGVVVRHGSPPECIPRLARELGVDTVFANRDYEPAAIARDREVARRLKEIGVGFEDFKDQVIFDRDEVLNQAGRPFSVFTPYRNVWLKQLDDFQLTSYPIEKHAARLAPKPAGERMPTLADIGFEPTNLPELKLPTGMSGGQRLFEDFQARIDDYRRARDFPAAKGVSYLSAHLRFGTVSIRRLAAFAARHGGEGANTWLSELAWRDFYQMILWHRPDVIDHTFRPECDGIAWDDTPDLFDAWREARTGYPLIDAAMRQLHQTGYMHNRLRMVAASFLTKDLGIDWRRGERHFAEHLNDYDLAANNGGWQWAASTGCDAQPWFRIFNPVMQSEKFDPDGRFIRRYLPELARVPDKFVHAPWIMNSSQQADVGIRIGSDYPAPVVDHAAARQRTLNRFSALGKDR
ncbi:MAG: deoxyribodipyrimidine photo-lyase [Rhodocyclaceae bacterium]|jgi:deoxyribodipyrimidine photo-lyase|nr:deoxyribodipyrimidine photo-lyase [Rhodocyclaceae bacterium]MBK6554159.1 deoxyribodipyrimidine photo-lyase [Rhodocyclaceae bacterium]MBK9310558.1 deoxyribodipyrimidine photo-lyase [Rhodocyclaceae bacterium]MBK9954371.1 deoxyribodipyrimidine photo-lyase [Rhodocyclaceae bacterium]